MLCINVKCVCLCLSRVSSGAPESPAGVGVVGLHQPSAEEGHGGDRTRQKDRQALSAAGGSQVSFPEPQGKSQKQVSSVSVRVHFKMTIK